MFSELGLSTAVSSYKTFPSKMFRNKTSKTGSDHFQKLYMLFNFCLKLFVILSKGLYVHTRESSGMFFKYVGDRKPILFLALLIIPSGGYLKTDK
jgi:hypothetical protein